MFTHILDGRRHKTENNNNYKNNFQFSVHVDIRLPSTHRLHNYISFRVIKYSIHEWLVGMMRRKMNHSKPLSDKKKCTD